jgi:hypothetical protein
MQGGRERNIRGCPALTIQVEPERLWIKSEEGIMKALAAIAALLFLAASLAAQGPSGAAKTAKTNFTRKEIKHMRKMKKQALRFRDLDRVCVHLTDRSQAEGQLMGVNNEGIQIGIWFPKCGDHTMPDSTQDQSSRFIAFGQIHSIQFASVNGPNYFATGAAYGLLGPLGWWVEWMLATGRAED